MATSLNNLAELYQAQSKCSDAKALYKRSLKIREKALGENHHLVATVLENMAKCCAKMGKRDKAEKLEARAAKIRSGW